tara:strand:- start:318 stop:476 length:159 start_codon:yes stop_codon:yes gene_type:complete
MPKGLYANMNKRKKAGTSRSKKKSTVSPKTYAKMKAKKGSFKPKKKTTKRSY